MAVHRFSASRSPTQLLMNGILVNWESGFPHDEKRTYQDLAHARTDTATSNTASSHLYVLFAESSKESSDVWGTKHGAPAFGNASGNEDAARRRHRWHPLFGSSDHGPYTVPAFGPGRSTGDGGVVRRKNGIAFATSTDFPTTSALVVASMRFHKWIR